MWARSTTPWVADPAGVLCFFPSALGGTSISCTKSRIAKHGIEDPPNAISKMAEDAQDLIDQAHRYDQPRAAFYEHPNHQHRARDEDG